MVPTTYKTRLARMIAGEGTWSLVPAYAALGSGRYNPATGELSAPSPGDTGLASPLAGYGNLPLTLSRVGTATRVEVRVPGGANPVDVTEAGVFTADRVPILLASFRPIRLQAPLTLVLIYTIYPEV